MTKDIPHIIIAKCYNGICSILVKNMKISQFIKDSFKQLFPVEKHKIEFSVTDHFAGPTSELIKRDGKYTVFIK